MRFKTPMSLVVSILVVGVFFLTSAQPLREKIDGDQGTGTNRKGDREDSLWIDRLASRVGDILPALIGPEHADHRQSESDNSRRLPNRRICITEYGMCATPEKNSAECQNCADLDCRGYVQQVRAFSGSQDVYHCDHGDHEHRDDFYLHRRELNELSEVVAEGDR